MERVEDDGLHLYLDALCPFHDITGHLIVVQIRIICQEVCAEVQRFSLTNTHGINDLEWWVFLVTLVTSPFGRLSAVQL